MNFIFILVIVLFIFGWIDTIVTFTIVDLQKKTYVGT